MNNSITLGNNLPITANIPKQIPNYAFGTTVNPLIMDEFNKPKPFSTKGMVGTARDLYGVADLSNEYAKAEKDGTHQFMISNDEYMSRQTGIPADKYHKFRQATNKARLGMGIYGPLALQPNQLSIKTKLPNYNDTGSHHVVGTVLDRNDPDETYTYVGHRPTRAEAEFGKQLKNLPYPYLLSVAVSGGFSPHSALRQSTVTNPDPGLQLFLSYLPSSMTQPRSTISIMDTLKHEIAHANTDRYRFGDISSYSRYADAGFTDNADMDKIRTRNYDLGSPKTQFRQDTYFGDRDESWGAANRIKNDGAGLFYSKYGRLPGMDEYDNPIANELKLKDIDEVVDLFYDHNPGDLTLEYNRIYNTTRGNNTLEKKESIKNWFRLRPVTEYPTKGLPNTNNYAKHKHTDIFNFDLARNNGPLQNVKMANINGLVKAASVIQKDAGKIMKVRVSNMEYAKDSLAMRCMWPRYVYMPDCEKYRNIVNGSSKSAKAKLAQKFWLNLPDSVKFAACDLDVIE